MTTTADSLMGLRLVRGPGWDSLELSDEALGMIADALEFTADDSRSTAVTLRGEGDASGAAIAEDEAQRMDLLAEAIRGTDDGHLWLSQNDNTLALLRGLTEAGVTRC